jgi:hypothetical protein
VRSVTKGGKSVSAAVEQLTRYEDQDERVEAGRHGGRVVECLDVVLISGTLIEGGKSSQGSRPFAGRASLKRGEDYRQHLVERSEG